MAARKLQQEVDKCFKKVDEGVAEFESIYEKIEQSTNAAQKEKLEDNLKKEIKKLQRLRDQIKTWAASNEVKDKGPLLEKRKLIETQMEKFKAVEKAMKTKAFSKEGLSAPGKLDPKERARMETCEFLNNMVDELERQVETLEAEGESIQATMKKGKANSSKAERIAEIELVTERHKWHQGKLELIKRSLENSAIDTDQVAELEDTIKYYVSNHTDVDYVWDDEMYDELDLQEEEDTYGMNNDNDRVSSQDTQSIQEDAPDMEPRLPPGKSKSTSISEPPGAAARRPSTHTKSPLPALATLHTPSSHTTNGASTAHMKPAPQPMRAPGETLKYASAAAAAAASERNNLGIAPLPPPPDAPSLPSSSSHPPVPSHTAQKPSITASPKTVPSQAPAPMPRQSSTSTVPEQVTASQAKSPAPAPSQPSITTANQIPQPSAAEVSGRDVSHTTAVKTSVPEVAETSIAPQINGLANGTKHTTSEDAESVYHLPSGLQDLLSSFEATQRKVSNASSQSAQRMLTASLSSNPAITDIAAPRNYKPENRFITPGYYPQAIDPVFDDPRMYTHIDPDTLFYVFYYKQGSYQQYLAAKALKDQSWRFHKQYQTWFQRHEEPKTITEEFEQGTYRFFDYESTWMNRRKADFKFAYKFLEDDL